MLITAKMILDKDPCHYTEESLIKLLGNGKSPLDAMNLKGVSDKDKIWAATRFLPDKVNREFAIWCARQCETKKKEIISYIDTIEKFHAGAAYRAAAVACWTAYKAADSAKMRKKQVAKIKSLINRTLTECKQRQEMKRCKDCKWHRFLWDMYLDICMNSPRKDSMYGGMACQNPNTCKNYHRKWWKFWIPK